jgi:hypothetical protein
VTQQRAIKVYPKEAHLMKSTEEKWGVPKLKGQRIKKKLLVLGTGRCGTMFTGRAMRTAGVNILHEKVGQDGTVSHYFVTDSDWYPMAPWQKKANKKHVGERRDDFDFEHIFHIVRNPMKAIPSMVKIFGSVTWDFYVQNGLLPEGLHGLHRAAYLWLSHNMAAEAQAHRTFQLERYREAWPMLMEELGSDAAFPGHIKPMNKTGGFRAYEPIKLADLTAIDATLARNIAKLARHYGYEV